VSRIRVTFELFKNTWTSRRETSATISRPESFISLSLFFFATSQHPLLISSAAITAAAVRANYIVLSARNDENQKLQPDRNKRANEDGISIPWIRRSYVTIATFATAETSARAVLSERKVVPSVDPLAAQN